MRRVLLKCKMSVFKKKAWKCVSPTAQFWRWSPDQRNSIHSRKEDTTDRQQNIYKAVFNEIFPWSYHPLCAPFGEIIVIGLSCSLYGLCQRCAQRAQRSLSVDMPSESVGNAGQYRVKPNWIEIDTCESIYLMARICPKRTIKWNNSKKAWNMYSFKNESE